MRNKIWKWLRKKHPEGQILTPWLLTVRTFLYPLDFFYWRMSEARGYQWQSDTWKIEGVTYSGSALIALAEAQGETYRISRTGDTVTLTRVLSAPAKRAAESGSALGAELGGTEQNK